MALSFRKVLFSGVCSQTTEVRPAELFYFPNRLIKRTYVIFFQKKKKTSKNATVLLIYYVKDLNREDNDNVFTSDAHF